MTVVSISQASVTVCYVTYPADHVTLCWSVFMGSDNTPDIDYCNNINNDNIFSSLTWKVCNP